MMMACNMCMSIGFPIVSRFTHETNYPVFSRIACLRPERFAGIHKYLDNTVHQEKSPFHPDRSVPAGQRPPPHSANIPICTGRSDTLFRFCIDRQNQPAVPPVPWNTGSKQICGCHEKHLPWNGYRQNLIPTDSGDGVLVTHLHP